MSNKKLIDVVNKNNKLSYDDIIKLPEIQYLIKLNKTKLLNFKIRNCNVTAQFMMDQYSLKEEIRHFNSDDTESLNIGRIHYTLSDPDEYGNIDEFEKNF